MMKEHLYQFCLEDKRTGEMIYLRILAENTDVAAHKITKAVFGAYGEYRLTGSGPLYKNNQLITRESKEN